MDARLTGCRINRIIERALHDASDVLEDKGVLIVAHLEATTPFDDAPAALEQALYTVVRALAERISVGTTLHILTQDRAGGDIELSWEAREPETGVSDDVPLRKVVRPGPYGDLLELAIVGLEAVSRMRGAHRAQHLPATTSSSVLDLRAAVRRKYLFLLPAPSRVGTSG